MSQVQKRYTHSQLIEASSIYDGSSCGPEDSQDSIVGQTNGQDDGHTGQRMDSNGTFQDLNLCCIVQKCVFGETPDACAGSNTVCPSLWGSYNPKTCVAEDPVPDGDDEDSRNDAHRQGYFRSSEDCCLHWRTRESCNTRSPDDEQPWEQACCHNQSYDNPDNSDNPYETEDNFLIA